MPSPFPGMDPYLESPTHWSDFHARFINTLTDAINDRLPENYVARISEHVMMIAPTLRDDGDEDASYVPDVTVRLTGEYAGGSGTAAVAPAPVTLTNLKYLDDHVEGFVQVVRLPEMQVVTVLELFSPTNKYGEGLGIYMKKRRDFLAQPINIVELDLLRAGARIEFERPLPVGHYHAFISRAGHRPQTEVHSWTVRDRFPTLAIPLQQKDNDVLLDLVMPFTVAYDAGRYGKIIRYDSPPPAPAFSSADATWVKSTVTKSSTTIAQ
jgi:hypothetical protein